MTCRAAFLGTKRLTPSPEDLISIDQQITETAGTDLSAKYSVALNVIYQATRGMTGGFLRLDPTHEVRPAKEHKPAIDQVEGEQG